MRINKAKIRTKIWPKKRSKSRSQNLRNPSLMESTCRRLSLRGRDQVPNPSWTSKSKRYFQAISSSQKGRETLSRGWWSSKDPILISRLYQPRVPDRLPKAKGQRDQDSQWAWLMGRGIYLKGPTPLPSKIERTPYPSHYPWWSWEMLKSPNLCLRRRNSGSITSALVLMANPGGD